MNNINFYHESVPEFLEEFLRSPELLRLKNIGMDCGCEYTSFPLFRGKVPYSRYRHSLGVALIVWHFTGSMVQTLAGLFHDIATPVFAHSIDFFHGDYITQESTERGTEALVRRFEEPLGRLGISVSQVSDYHMYPIADNDSPRLSADRLEYTLGNAFRYGSLESGLAKPLYENVVVTTAEDGAEELAFADEEAANTFAGCALRCAKVYVAPEDRYSMQMLAELLRRAVGRGVVSENDFYLTEPEVIARLRADAESRKDWERFRTLRQMVHEEWVPEADRRVITAKKRYIDPLVKGRGRLSEINAGFRKELDDFIAAPLDGWLYGC